MFQVYGSLSQWNYLKLEIGILDSVLRQWNDFEDFIYNLCKINGADLFSNKARKLKFAESNQAKASLTTVASYWRSQPLAGRLRAIRPTLVGYVC